MNPEPVSHEQRIVALPPELFRHIIQYLSKDRQALCAISLVCKFLQDEGQRQLYRRVSFPDSSTPETHIKFLKSILDNNRLALLVREYAQYDVALDKKGTLWDYLCHGLQAMANLKRLHFRAFGGQPSAEILTNCTFQLRVLVWGNYNDEDHLSQFLLSQHSLRGLVVDWAEDKRDLIPTSCCPRLSDLRGLNQGAVETFLPGRKITSLSWTTHSLKLDSSYKIDSFESFLPYLSRIRFLSLGVSFSRVYIRSIVRYFPRVEVFEFRHPAVDSHEVSGSSSISSSLSFDSISVTIQPIGLGAFLPKKIANPCNFTYLERTCAATHQPIHKLEEVATNPCCSRFGELSNLSMDSGGARCSVYAYCLSRGSSTVACLNRDV